MAKCVLKVAGQEVKEICGMEQLYGGVEAGIKGGISVMCLLWVQHAQEYSWVFLIIDAHNTFNEDNWTEMLWDIIFKWTRGGWFTFN